MKVTRESVVSELIETYPGIENVFAEHGVEVEFECSHDVQELDLEFCETACHIDDLDSLIVDLNKYVENHAAKV